MIKIKCWKQNSNHGLFGVALADSQLRLHYNPELMIIDVKINSSCEGHAKAK
jgi:hypothetical protein